MNELSILDLSVLELAALGQVVLFSPGDLFEDCDLRPCLCLVGNENGDPHVSGIALTDGAMAFCSSTACGLRRISAEDVLPMREAWFARTAKG